MSTTVEGVYDPKEATSKELALNSTSQRHNFDLDLPMTRSLSASLINLTKRQLRLEEIEEAQKKKQLFKDKDDSGLFSFDKVHQPPSMLKLRGRTRTRSADKGNANSHSRATSKERALSSSPTNNAGHSSDLKELVRHQSKLLEWFTSKHPKPPPSSLHESIKGHESSPSWMITLFKSYETRLGEVEKENSKLKKELKHSKDKHESELQSQSDLFRQNELAVESRYRSELRSMESLQEQNSVSSTTVGKLTDTLRSLENKLIESTDRLERSVKTNQALAKKLTETDAMLVDSEKKLMDCSRERDRAQRWVKAYQGSVEDYESCIRESGLASILHEDIIHETTPGSLLLTRHVKNIIRELQDLYKKSSHLEKEKETLLKNHATALQSYMLDLERKKSELYSTKNHLSETVSMAERARAEREQAFNQLQTITKDYAQNEANLAKLQREKDEEITDIMSKSAKQLKHLRDEFDVERHHLQSQIDELHKSKVELQVEVGHLSRERRAKTIELESVHRNIELTRDQFRRDLGIN